MGISYKDAGVDISTAEVLTRKIKKIVQSTYGTQVYQGVGGFASLYQITEDKLLAAGADGVGTKLKVAQRLDIHDTIGIDLVAMCANDILCTGARSLFFLDYLSCGKLELAVAESIISGIATGCRQVGAALIGGETAEMPGMYGPGEYDLGGFIVGEVAKSELIDGRKLRGGESIIGLPASGFHSNGFSLIRTLLKDDEEDLWRQSLMPTLLYQKVVGELLGTIPGAILGMAHITGGGLTNIPRINDQFDYHLSNLPEKLPPPMNIIVARSQLPPAELYRTFNMGVGFVLVTASPQEVKEFLRQKNQPFFDLGKTVRGQGKVIARDFTL